MRLRAENEWGAQVRVARARAQLRARVQSSGAPIGLSKISPRAWRTVKMPRTVFVVTSTLGGMRTVDLMVPRGGAALAPDEELPPDTAACPHTPTIRALAWYMSRPLLEGGGAQYAQGAGGAGAGGADVHAATQLPTIVDVPREASTHLC